MIVQTVNVHTFRQAFIDMGRGDQFSYDGLKALFEHLEEMSEASDMDIELDVIGLCCEYNEMSWAEFAKEYENLVPMDEWDECEGWDDRKDILVDIINDHSFIVGDLGDRVVFQAF